MAKQDVSAYADKAPTDHHKWFATWIVREVGYDPNSAGSKREAFLAGVSIATAARSAFQDSEFLEQMREKHGVNKRGPKPAVREEPEEEERPARRTAAKKTAPAKKAAPARKRQPEPEPEEEEWDDSAEEADEFEDDADAEEADEFEDDVEEDDADFDDDFEEPTPPKRPAKKAPAKAAPARKAAPAKKAAPTKAAARKRQPAADDDFMF